MHETEHYEKGVYAPINIIDFYDLNFSLGCVIKYTLRAGKKKGESKLKDLKKALDYVQHEVERLEASGVCVENVE